MNLAHSCNDTPFPVTIDSIRSKFPALTAGFAFLENAGGSQLPSSVIEAVTDHLTNHFVQLGAGYAHADTATRAVEHAHQFASLIMGTNDTGRTIIGASSTQLVNLLAQTLAKGWKKEAVVVASFGHEANIGAWLDLERSGAEIRWWNIDPKSVKPSLTDLRELLGDNKVRLLTFPHVSNLLGDVMPIEEITALAHEYGAKVVVDGVAYAPHRLLEVSDWGVDWYFFSAYKVYAPHLGILWGSDHAFEGLIGPNHFFIDPSTSSKFELGGSNHEACSGLNGLSPYLKFIAGTDSVQPIDRNTIVSAFQTIEDLEVPIQERFLNYLREKDVRILGSHSAGPERVPTFSFVHNNISSKEIADFVNKTNQFGIRNGHMYSYRLCSQLGLDPEDGVVRVSMVHYNTLDEVERLIHVLDDILGG